MEEDIKGKFVTRTKENGVKYKLYVPKNVNADTPIFTYAYGSGDPNMEKCVSELGSDSIIIATIVDYDADLGSITMDIVNDVKQEYGVTSTIVSPSGFSLGGPAGLEVAAQNIRQNPDCEPQTVFLIDAYGTFFYNPSLHLNDTDTMNLFKENKTVFFAFDLDQKTSDINKLYAEAGLNVIMVKCNGQSHGEINSSFFSNGIYDYMAGGTLPEEGYTYQVYNKETGQWEDINYEDIATKEALYNYYNIDTFTTRLKSLSSLEDITIESDDKTLQNYLNEIRGAIRNSNFLQGNFTATSYASTTKVPSSIPEIVNNYFTETTELLSKLANETTQFTKIHTSIEDLDFHLKVEAEEIPEDTLTSDTTVSTPSQTTTSEEVNTSSDSIIQNVVVGTLTGIVGSVVDSVADSVNSTIQTTEETIKATNQNNSDNTDNKANQSISQTNQSATSVSTNNNQTKSPLEEFPKYEELYSDDTKIVYNYNDEYKIIIHKDGDKIIGIEHYYDFETSTSAHQAIDTLTAEYSANTNFDKIVQCDRYVKVIFKEDMYKDISLNDFKEKYKDLDEVLKQL